MIHRRGFLAGLGALLAAPAIIRTPGLLMPVRPIIEPARIWVDWGRPGGDFSAAVLMRFDGSLVAVWSAEALPGAGSTMEIAWRATVDGNRFFDVHLDPSRPQHEVTLRSQGEQEEGSLPSDTAKS